MLQPYRFKKHHKKIPHSKMVCPPTFRDRLTYYLWRIYTPFHPLVRDVALWSRVVSHSGRQHFLIGTIALDTSLEEVINALVLHGYGNHFIAWKDEGEIASLRKVSNFVYQYHIRIFHDGEVRGHYEYTPEYSPTLHMQAAHFVDVRDEFLLILKDFLHTDQPHATLQ